METKKSIFISGISGLGKSHFARENPSLAVDCEHLPFKYKLGGDETELENIKGLRQRDINPNYPKNYFDFIDSVDGKFPILLTTGDEIIEYLRAKNEKLHYFVPCADDLEAIIARLKSRGNSEDFIRDFRANYLDWLKIDYSGNVIKHELKKGEFIGDAILRENLLNSFKNHLT
ncbi:MAG: hypothetical protein LBM01_00875 [Christensenellaceae bacterium]|jgi:hypothetical protein|nr:hypothetical protein [Christensenellaceae bacterium]